MQRNRAFTLLELLIASSIFIVVMMTIYSSFHAGVFGYRNIEETINTYQSIWQVMERINIDLRNSFCYSSEESKFVGKNTEISFLTLYDSYKEDKFIKKYAFVSYSLDNNKLMRSCRVDQDALNSKSESTSEEMADQLTIAFTYLYWDKESNAKKEKDSWEDEKKSLPLAVKVSLHTKGKVEPDFTRTIYLPCSYDVTPLAP